MLMLLHSMEDDKHSHSQPMVECEIIKQHNGNAIVRTPNGVVCTAIFNYFVCKWFADDLYGIVEDNYVI